jgi:hypothetical protein
MFNRYVSGVLCHIIKKDILNITLQNESNWLEHALCSSRSFSTDCTFGGKTERSLLKILARIKNLCNALLILAHTSLYLTPSNGARTDVTD